MRTCGCAAKIACQQDRAKNGGTRNHIDDSAGEFEDPDAESQALGISEVSESLHDRRRLHQFHDATEEQQQYR